MAPTLSPWPNLAALPFEPVAGGNINRTWRVGRPPVAVVQRLSPIFSPQVNLDVEAVTAHLAARGVTTPRLLRTDRGALCHIDEGGHCWRALSWVPGRTYHRVPDRALAHAAGALVGRWHAATRDLRHTFHFERPGAHDTEGHMQAVVRALADHPGHRLRERVLDLSERVLSAWEGWRGGPSLKPRVCHGDLKISNLRFDDDGVGICLIDLDTLASLPLDIELADAFRSWCNPRGEDVVLADFDVTLFAAALAGYHGTYPLEDAVKQAIPAAIERICLELSARFLADALNEAYFAWDPKVATGRGEHNLLRATGQYHLARSAQGQRGQIERLLANLG
jgi:Ser/Thr protein kinase RdoA (MazF antagonist)